MPHDDTNRRDDVLAAFQRAHPRPGAEDIADWVERHPDLADDVRAHAEAILAAHQDQPGEEAPSPGLVARARDRALARLEAARARVAALRERS